MPTITSSTLRPQVVDASTLGQKLSADIFLPIGIEGQAATTGDATVGTLYTVKRVDEAVAHFGAASNLTLLISALLQRGAGPVYATASVKSASTPTLVQRQAAWAILEADNRVRIRLTDSEIQADIVALASSCSNAALLNNKQRAFVGMPTGTSKAAFITAAVAIQAAAAVGSSIPSKRAVLVGPGVYDENGTLRGGSFAAAYTAAEAAKNADPANDLDLWTLPLLTGIEKAASGLDLFRASVVSGAVVDDVEDLLQAGMSPLAPSRVPGGVSTTHLRTAYILDTTLDAWSTALIQDQLFIDVRDWILDSGILREGNTDLTRNRIVSGVNALLEARQAWVSKIQQGDGTYGYNVSASPSSDMRQVTVSYEGVIVRGIQTVQVQANLTIPA